MLLCNANTARERVRRAACAAQVRCKNSVTSVRGWGGGGAGGRAPGETEETVWWESHLVAAAALHPLGSSEPAIFRAACLPACVLLLPNDAVVRRCCRQ